MNEFELLLFFREIAVLANRAKAIFEKAKCCGTCNYWNNEDSFAKECSEAKQLPVGYCMANKDGMLYRYHLCNNYELREKLE